MDKIFVQLSNKINVNLLNDEIKMFFIYKDLLKEWNEKVNLTSIVEDNEIILKHFIDSLTIEKYIPSKAKIVDVGTGAGFPGIPIKIVRKDVEVTLLDSLKKRLLFLNEVRKRLELENINLVHGRAEDIANDLKYREKFDIATARAVANLATLSEYCLPFVKVNGYFVCMKGNNIEELKEAEFAIGKLGGKIEKIEKIMLPDSDIERNIVVIKKIKQTPKGYPRKAGTPSKNPLKGTEKK